MYNTYNKYIIYFIYCRIFQNRHQDSHLTETQALTAMVVQQASEGQPAVGLHPSVPRHLQPKRYYFYWFKSAAT
jgi:hypothetical protein